MKGIILAGGSGTRLSPLTKVINKCLLPVYDKPMIYHAIQLLVDSGIDEVLIICGGNSLGDFLPLLGNGEQFGLRDITYRVQSEPRGIADALGLAEHWAGDDNVCVLLSDNIFEFNVKDAISNFKSGAQIFLTQVEHPEHYGVAELDDLGNVVSITEKPKDYISNWAVSGLYVYDNTVWDFIKTLEPSARGELEITDVNNYFLNEGKLTAQKLNGWWADCGEDFDAYLDACNKVRRMHQPSQPELFYDCQFIEFEKVEVGQLGGIGSVVCWYAPTQYKMVPGTVTGTVYIAGCAVQTFHDSTDSMLVFNDCNDSEIKGSKGSIDCETGVVSMCWNTTPEVVNNTHIVVSYEYRLSENE